MRESEFTSLLIGQFDDREGAMATDRGTGGSSALAELAGLLRDWRQRALLTQEQLAQRTGLSARTIGRLEAGGLQPRAESIRLLADALGLSGAEREMLAAAAQRRPSAPEPPATTTPSAAPVPRQLPADVAGFSGRDLHLAELDGLLAGDGGSGAVVLITAIAGAAGVGKTALAVHWAHRVADRFPDGQMHVNLHGYAEREPVSPIQALAQLLRGLGVGSDKVPVEVEEAAALYRSLLSGRRALVVLDNARDATQVRPLLPGDPGCVVVITSRDRLTGLVASHGAHRLLLDVLAPDEAVGLLAGVLGRKRVEADLEGAGELAEVCGRLPLALRIAAANLAGQPERAIGEYAARLRGDQLGGLAVPEDPEVGVRAAFEHSYTVLEPDARRLFRLLGLVPGPEVTPNAAAALATVGTVEAAELLERLAAAHLVEVRAPSRYGLHDLLRLYARQRAERQDDQADREAALERLIGWYLQGADAAARLLYPGTLRLPAPGGEKGLPPGFDEPTGALEWLDAERANLVAAITYAASNRQRPSAWLLADALRGYFWLRRHTVDWLVVAQAAFTAAAGEDDPQPQAAASLSLGQAYWSVGRYPQAIEHLTAALALARKAGWVDGQAATFGNLGTVYGDMGSLAQAADHHTQALVLYQRSGRLAGQATTLANLGHINWQLGRLQQAADHFAQALAVDRKTGSRRDQGTVLGNLAEVHNDLGLLDQALEDISEALALHREVGDRYGEAYSLQTLARVHRDAGRHDQALEQASSALALAGELGGDRHARADALNTLGSVNLAGGHPRAAEDQHHQALNLAREVGARYPEADALLGLAGARHALGQHDQAIEDAELALALAHKASYQVLEGHAHTLLAAAHLARDRHEQVAEHARRALDLHRATGHRLGEERTLRIMEQLPHHV